MREQLDSMELEHPDPLFSGGGQLAAYMRSMDWSATPLGSAETWPHSLRTSVSICLNSSFAILVWWGPELVALYNDAYAPIIASKHPWALGKAGKQIFPEIWDIVGPMLSRVLSHGEAVRADDLLLFLERNAYPEECYFTFSYSPILDENGTVGGVFTPVQETTERVIGERRLTSLTHVAEARSHATGGVQAVLTQISGALAANRADLPFFAIYLLEQDQTTARVAACSQSKIVPETMAPAGAPFAWERVLGGELVVTPAASTPELARSAWGRPVEAFAIVPFGQSSSNSIRGFLLAALNPHKHLDESYRSFLSLLADHIGGAIADAEAAEQERRRVEAMAEIDRAKTVFFSNISHEFRTPLTLIIGPVHDLLANQTTPAEVRDALTLVQHNSVRLQKLVTSLLDFSRIEAGRTQTNLRPVRLGQLTQDLASGFRSTFDRAGLSLNVTIPESEEPVLVDPDMWEKIVLNLLSNAFKFTFHGGAGVELRHHRDSVHLTVADTGVGIPVSELPHIFERFRRVEGGHGRSYEGTGIGLALVQELVKLHGGTIGVQSRSGEGTAFTITIPVAPSHPGDEIPDDAEVMASTLQRIEAYVSEAERWTASVNNHGFSIATDSIPAGNAISVPARPGGARYRILIADDNADMRQYAGRLLSEQHELSFAANGQHALELIRRQRPDLLLCDVMMPILDGATLVKMLRGDPKTSTIPIILMSARAGREAEMEGLRLGADEYLVKPFTGVELVTRVQSMLKVAALRNEAEQRLRMSEERLRLALEAADIGIWVMDLLGGTSHADERTKAVFGMSPDADARYDDFIAAIHPEDRERVLQAMRATLDPNGTGLYEIEYRTIGVEDGICRWIAAKGRASFEEKEGVRFTTRFAGTVVDVTRQQLTELAVFESRERAREVLERTTDAVFMLNSAWDFTYLNPNAVRLIALGRDLVGKNLWTEFPDALDREFARQYRRVMDEQVSVHFEEFYPEPLNRWFDVYAYPMQDGIAVFFHDSTARRKSEQALIQSEKLAAAGRLAASVSHEINNPLESVTNLLYLIESDQSLSQPARAYLSLAQTQLTRVSRIATQTLRFYRQSTNPTDVNLQDLLDEVLAFYANRLASGPISVIRRYRNVPAIHAFGGELRQVFTNLIGNAIDALPEHGRLLLGIQALPQALFGRDYAVVTVADTGTGISRDTLKRVFEPFFSTKGMTGTGLGLWVSRQLIDKHGGKIKVRSSDRAPHRGTVFTVWIPLDQTTPSSANPSDISR